MQNLRYVILRHEGVAEPHFDLMFEASPGAPLLTWRSMEWPIDREAKLTKIEDAK